MDFRSCRRQSWYLARCCKHRREATDGLDSFEAAVGREFAKRIESALGKDSLKCAELLSPLTHVGVSGNFESELKLICEIFGDGQWDLTRVLAELGNLEKAGLARRGGSSAEITIPFLANYLVTSLLRGRRDEILVAFFARLHELGTVRLIRRLSQIRTPEVDRFWDALFEDPPAPFGSLDSALRHEQMLRFVAGATPERTLRLLERELLHSSHEERMAISGEPRRELVWGLEQLLFRAKTSRGALKLVWLLAESENETWGNNATGILSEIFHPLHEQMPLPLDERLAMLREFTAAPVSKNGKLVAIEAAGVALSRQSHQLRHSTGTAPLDSMPLLTYQDVDEYIRSLTDHLLLLAETDEEEIARAALERVLNLVAEMPQPKDALERIDKLVNWVLVEEQNVSIASLYRVIRFIRRRIVEKEGIHGDLSREGQQIIQQLDQLVNKLESGNFAVRIKRWAGRRQRTDRDEVIINGQRVYRFDHELRNLAKEVISNPSLLTPDLLLWLLSKTALQSNLFFFHLGREDTNSRLRSKIEDVGANSEGAIGFGSYWSGQAQIDRSKTEARLEDLTRERAIASDVFVSAIADLGPSDSILNLLGDEISKNWVSAKAISGFLYGQWIREISSKQLLMLLGLLASKQLENASIAIEIIGRWLDEDRPLEEELTEFAWRCLEAAPAVSQDEIYACDKVAARLAQIDHNRGFGLLETLLSQVEHKRSWCPIDRYAGGNEFWNALRGFDRERALHTVFSVALRDPSLGFVSHGTSKRS